MMPYMALITLLFMPSNPVPAPAAQFFCNPEKNIYIYFASVPDCKKGKIIVFLNLCNSWAESHAWFMEDVQDVVITSYRYFQTV